jgi:proline iminopeptidase
MNRDPRIYPRSTAPGPRLPVGQGHTLWWQVWGPVDGEPWLVLHGGPGSASHAGMAAPFDLRRQRVVLYDQRGCGRSRPQGDTRHNRLSALVQDIEALRRHLGLARWSVLGGSWGATLALNYAAAHPEAVERLVLRGAFDARSRVVQRLFARHATAPGAVPPETLPRLDHPPASRPLFHRLSQLFRNGTPPVTVRRLARAWEAMEARAALHGIRRSVRAMQGGTTGRSADLIGQRTLAARMHKQARRQAAVLAWPRATRSDRALQAKFAIQAHYLKHGCFMNSTAWHQLLHRIAQAGIPTHWVHGEYDSVCPISTAQRAHAALNRWQPGLSTFRRVKAGHLGIEAPLARALRSQVSERQP